MRIKNRTEIWRKERLNLVIKRVNEIKEKYEFKVRLDAVESIDDYQGSLNIYLNDKEISLSEIGIIYRLFKVAWDMVGEYTVRIYDLNENEILWKTIGYCP